MSKQIYTNPAFCQSSEFYPIPSATHQSSSYHNRSLNFNSTSVNVTRNNPRDGPLRIQRSMSTRSFGSKSSLAAIHQKQQQQQQHQQQQNQRKSVRSNDAKRINTTATSATPTPLNLNCTAEPFENRRAGSGRYALVPVEELPMSRNNRYAIVPDEMANIVTTKRLAKSQDNLQSYISRSQEEDPQRDEERHLFHDELPDQYTSLPPISMYEDLPLPPSQHLKNLPASRMKPAFSSDFGSKSFVIFDQKSNQRYTMVPTAEDEELVDDNQEIIQMHNGRVHRYAVIPTDEEEEETCLSTSDLNQSHSQSFSSSFEPSQTPQQSSTPQKGMVTTSMPGTPLKNPAATRMLHELLSTPRGVPPPLMRQRSQRQQSNYSQSSEKRQNYSNGKESSSSAAAAAAAPTTSPHPLHYESVRQRQAVHSADAAARSLAVISPRVAGTNYSHPDDLGSVYDKSWNDSSYPQKVANATITLAIVSLMLILGSAVNTGLSIYMIAYMGKSFYLQFSLVASFAGVGLGFLGFRSRHCEWLPNRSYISGYVLVTIFCLFKCCGLLLLLVLNPYPGFPLHDVTTGVILGLSSFTIFFIGLGVIGSLWCFRPPPDNRVNVV